MKNSVALVYFLNSTHHLCSKRQAWHKPWRRTYSMDWGLCIRERDHFGLTSSQYHSYLYLSSLVSTASSFNTFFNLIPLSCSLSKSPPLKAWIFWCVSTQTPAHPIPSHTPTIEMAGWLYWISTIQKEYGQTVYSCHTCIISGLDNEDPMWLRAWSVLVPASAITEARKGAHEKLRWDSLGVLACSHRVRTFRILLK